MLFYYYKKSYQKMFDFEGRASRSEYWYNVLGNFLITFLYSFVFTTLIKVLKLPYKKEANLSEQPMLVIVLSIIGSLWIISRIIPSLSLSIRRLHDSGKSGWFFLINLIPIIGIIIFFIFTLQASQEGKNQYGENPSKEDKKLKKTK